MTQIDLLGDKLGDGLIKSDKGPKDGSTYIRKAAESVEKYRNISTKVSSVPTKHEPAVDLGSDWFGIEKDTLIRLLELAYRGVEGTGTKDFNQAKREYNDFVKGLPKDMQRPYLGAS